MKLKENFFIHESDGEMVLVSADRSIFSGFVRCNETAAYIIGCLKDETDVNSICDRVFSEFEAPKEMIEKDVENVLGMLRKIGALEE